MEPYHRSNLPFVIAGLVLAVFSAIGVYFIASPPSSWVDRANTACSTHNGIQQIDPNYHTAVLCKDGTAVQP